ncbi:MAG: hypothetical protein LQ344_000832 [Seirophora lacunosa]|nr:MAG: hypothetical protein LQ344_000832 [Seirophora lacunosa]
MASTDYQPPNLATILQTLAAYAPPPPQPQPPPPQPPSHPPSTDLEEGEYDPSNFQPSSQPSQPLPPQPIQQHPSTPSPSTKASLITTWPPALRHTTHLLSTQPAFLPRLRHLIRSAHAHERQWWDDRLALQQRLSTRDAGRRKISSVLASLGGGGGVDEGSAAAAAPLGGAAGEAERELRAYDRKVCRAYGEMVKATGEELGRLGVPFFGMKEGSVVRDGEGEVGEGKVGEGELERLKGRMVEFLEDMVKE